MQRGLRSDTFLSIIKHHLNVRYTESNSFFFALKSASEIAGKEEDNSATIEFEVRATVDLRLVG